METNNNQIATGIIVASILLILLCTFTLLFVLLFIDKKRRMQRANDLMKATFEKELLQSRIEIQEQTLKKISQEIHDNIGQVLSLVNVNLTLVEAKNDYSDIKITNAIDLVNTAIQDLRDISRSLNTDNIIEKGLIAVVENELEIIRKSGVDITFIAEGKECKLLPQMELILFRMLQECLNNCIKHAKAKEIIITANYGVHYLELAILDNGIGFNTSDIKKGQGLNNLEHRSKFINAQFEIESEENKGTIVRIKVPFSQIELLENLKL
jgi:signal transduction histidine kinase